MCGILGIQGEKRGVYDGYKINSMLLALSHRGPDDKGIVNFENCTLGHTRLSIIDLSGGNQPMRDSESDMAITFNGEIYNYKELKAELETKGHRFFTQSDTEVILKAYQEYGPRCLEFFEGMFAFAVWDNKKQELFIARDRFGKKPIYYTYDKAGNLLFASEIKALFSSGEIKGILDYQAIDNYLTLMYIPPWKTAYKNIHTIPPASFALFKGGAVEIKKYWQLKKKNTSLSYEQSLQEVKRLLSASVKKRMVADVEVGSFLSGGVDSTLVTSFAQPLSATPIKTFSVGYQDYINELPFAALAAKTIGTDHHELQAKDDIPKELEKVMTYFDEPHADSSDFPQSLLSKFARTKVKVALSGDGADELFLGYGWYTRHKNLSWRAHFKEKLFMNPFRGFLNAVRVFTPQERKKLWKEKGVVNDDIVSDEVKKSALSSAEKINLFDLTTYLPGQLLGKVDRMGMMHSLEVRSPFLDRELAEFIYSLPEEYKTDKSVYKRILKDILEETMPKEFVHRRKQGFGAPVKKWLLEDSLKKSVYETLTSPAAEIGKHMNVSFVKILLDRFYREGKDEYNYKIWVLYSLELWLRTHREYHQ